MYIYIRCLNIDAYIGCLDIHGYIGCLKIYRTHVTVDYFANNDIFLFCFRFDNSILLQQLIRLHNALDKREKIFCVIYLETKSFESVQAKLHKSLILTINPRKV